MLADAHISSLGYLWGYAYQFFGSRVYLVIYLNPSAHK